MTMAESTHTSNVTWTAIMGSALIFIGLALFLTVFWVMFPILSDPTSTYDRWFPEEAVVAIEPGDPVPVAPVPDVPVPTTIAGIGSFQDPTAVVGDLEDQVLTSVETTVESAVDRIGVSIEETLDEAIGSVKSTARGVVTVVLFALAALATTIVAWRVSRIGAMILQPSTMIKRRRMRSRRRHGESSTSDLEPIAEELEPEFA